MLFRSLVDGGFGNDVLFGGLGNNALIGWYGDDVFVMDPSSTGFNNAIDGGIGFDVVDYSSAGNITVNGPIQGININLAVGGAAVIPVGVNVPDSFLSIEGAIGTLGNDTIVGGAAVVTDAAGAPVLDALGNQIPIDFWLWGNNGNDIITGDAGNDHLSGGLGNDTIDGGAGIDILDFSDTTSAITMTLLTEIGRAHV